MNETLEGLLTKLNYVKRAMKEKKKKIINVGALVILLISLMPIGVMAEEVTTPSMNDQMIKIPEKISGELLRIETGIDLAQQEAPQSRVITEAIQTSAIEGDFEYCDVEGGIAINRYIGAGGDVVIPDTLDSKKVVAINDYAFAWCFELTDITIPSSVISIGDGAFMQCHKLTSIEIPNNVTSIGDSAFATCTGLTSITIPNGVTSIGDSVFHYCIKLTSIEIPNSVTSIGDDAFAYCSGLTSVTIPNSVTSIGDEAFFGCGGLTTITLSEKIISLGVNPFLGCNDLMSINVSNKNPNYTSIDGVLYDKSMTTLMGFPAGKASITIPNSVTSIGDSAFYYGTRLTSIEIPNSVTSIGDSAFTFCWGLTSIEIPNSVISIGDGAFHGCDELTSITLSESVISLGVNPFENCHNLMSINVSAKNPNYASIDGVLYDKSITTLMGCPSRKASIEIPNSVTSIGEWAFSKCTGLTNITIPDGVTAIGDGAFTGCSGLTSITIPDGVTAIGDGVFQICSGLTSITIPDNVTSIGKWAFAYCSGLTNITIPDGVTAIGDGAFSNCTGLTSIEIPNSETSIGDDAFEYCSGLTSITIPNSVTSIGHDAFYECSSNLNIYGIKGSYAETYAKDNKIPFKDIALVATLQSIAITTPTSKLRYQIGEILDINGMVITGTYSDGTTKLETITVENITGFDSSTAVENQILTVTVKGKTATYVVTVTDAIVNVTDVTLSETTKALTTGANFNLTPTFSPANATNKAVTWSSNKADIATVDAAGKVTAIKAGTATITVTTADGSKTATCMVTVKEPIHNIGATYQTHVQNVGWQGWKNSGEMSGTSGKSYRLEGIEINVDNQGFDIGVDYQSQIENIGWQGFRSDGELSGTEGKSLRLEAIQIKLTGADADKCDIYYQVHAQNYGWLGWAKNGESAGTEGFGYRLEAIKIVMLPKGSVAPGSVDKPFVKNN